MYMNANALIVGVGAPFALLAALVITIYLAKAGGDGGFLLVFFHIMVKWTEFFGGTEDDEGVGEDANESDNEKHSEREMMVPTSSTTKGHHSPTCSSRGSRDRLALQSNDTTGVNLVSPKAADSPDTTSSGRYRFYSVYTNNRRPGSAVTGSREREKEKERESPLTSTTELQQHQLPSAEEKTTQVDVGADLGLEVSMDGAGFSVGLVEVGEDFSHNESEQADTGLEDWRHVRSRGPSVAGTPMRSSLEADFQNGSFRIRSSAQRRRTRSSSVDSVVSGGERGSPSTLDKISSGSGSGLAFPVVLGNRAGAGSSLDDSDIPVYEPPMIRSLDGGPHFQLRATRSADYLPAEEEEDEDYLNGRSPGLGGLMKDSSYAALRLLERRGEEDSALVKFDLPKALKSHWIRQVTKKNLTIVGRVARSISTTDTFVSGVFRAFACLGVILTLMLATIAIAAHVQKQVAIFPQLIDFRHDVASGVMHFDHRIANVTLHTTPRERVGGYSEKREGPQYSVCSWRWNDLSALDFALLSEAAYFDDDGQGNIQGMVDSLFPSRNFTVRASHSPLMRLGAGPRFIEVSGMRESSNKLKPFTVLAVRGTDVGKFHDLMEDFMLYSEPIIFALLSTVFPTIRIWTHETTAHIIEWLYEFNSFFGLQGEAEYYGKLTTRVLQITESEREGHEVFITGHSLGGGLARIVGTLTGQGSVSFSPPGLGLSYRKYQLPDAPDSSSHHEQKRDERAHRMMRPSKPVKRGQMHHKSLAVIPEYDLFPQIDEQVGSVQHIQCDHENSFFCHLMEGTICHLLSHCGDSDVSRFQHCESSIDFGVVAPSIFSFLWKVRFVVGPLMLLGLSIFLLAVLPDMI